MKWIAGRQNTGYEKFPIIEKGFKCFQLLGFDCYLIRYLDGSFIPPHIDEVQGKHYRFNFIVKYPESGGEFSCTKFFQFWRLIFFRPDLHEHSVSKCVGTRYILSFGIVLK